VLPEGPQGYMVSPKPLAGMPKMLNKGASSLLWGWQPQFLEGPGDLRPFVHERERFG